MHQYSGWTPSLEPISEASGPLGHPIVEESAPPPPPENAKFFNKDVMTKLRIATGVTLATTAITAIIGSLILTSKNKEGRDFQDS